VSPCLCQRQTSFHALGDSKDSQQRFAYSPYLGSCYHSIATADVAALGLDYVSTRKASSEWFYLCADGSLSDFGCHWEHWVVITI
jgi:hypothetical protein